MAYRARISRWLPVVAVLSAACAPSDADPANACGGVSLDAAGEHVELDQACSSEDPGPAALWVDSCCDEPGLILRGCDGAHSLLVTAYDAMHTGVYTRGSAKYQDGDRTLVTPAASPSFSFELTGVPTGEGGTFTGSFSASVDDGGAARRLDGTFLVCHGEDLNLL